MAKYSNPKLVSLPTKSKTRKLGSVASTIRGVIDLVDTNPVVKSLFGKLASVKNIPDNQLPSSVIVHYLRRPVYSVKWDNQPHTKPLIRENTEYNGVFVAGRFGNKVVIGWAYDSLSGTHKQATAQLGVNKKEALNIACDRLLKSNRPRQLPASITDEMNNFIERCKRYYNNPNSKKYAPVTQFVVSGTDVLPNTLSGNVSQVQKVVNTALQLGHDISTKKQLDGSVEVTVNS